MAYANMAPTDLVIAAYDDTGAFVGDAIDYNDLSAKRLEFGNGEAMFTLPFEAPIVAASYATGMAGYRFTVKYWGQTFFDGVCVAMDDDDEEAGAATLDDIPVNVTVTCWGWARWLMSGRLIMGNGRDRFQPASDKADDVLRAMWRANMVTASLIQPTEYSTPGLIDPTTGGGPYTITRDDFGPFTVAVGADTGSHPDTVTWRWDHGRSLWDNTLEFCRRYNLRITTSVSGTTITFDVAYPATGTDRTASVRFDRERGNLIRFARRADRTVVSNVAECRGLRRRTNQIANYAVYRVSQLRDGVRETSEVWRSGNAQDTQNNADWLITQLGPAEVVHQFKLLELDNQKWGVHFDRGDKVTIYDSKRGITLTEYLTEMELSHRADDIPELNIIACIPPANEDRKGGRSGGGHGGGHARAGGHPKNSDGESILDPDDALSYAHFETQSGDVDAEGIAHYAKFQGKDTATYVRAKTYGTEGADSGSSGTPDLVEFEIVGDYEDVAPTANCSVKIRDAAGGFMRLLAFKI